MSIATPKNLRDVIPGGGNNVIEVITKKSFKRRTRNGSLWLFNMVQQMSVLLKWCQNSSDGEVKEISAVPEKVEKRQRRNVVQRMREKSRCHSGAFWEVVARALLIVGCCGCCGWTAGGVAS